MGEWLKAQSKVTDEKEIIQWNNDMRYKRINEMPIELQEFLEGYIPEYLPEGEEPKTFAAMSAPPGYNLQEMEAIARQVEDYFLPHVNADGQAYAAGKLAEGEWGVSTV